jgi:hypothetical protein
VSLYEASLSAVYEGIDGLKNAIRKFPLLELSLNDTPYDITSAHSLINKIPEEVKDVILTKCPVKLLFASEALLKREVQPDSQLNRIRLAFWKEYELSRVEYRMMSFGGVASQVGFPSILVRMDLTNPKKLAWVLCPPMSYENFLEEALLAGMQRLRDIIELSPVDMSTGLLDPKIADVQLKAVTFLDMRKHGGIKQRSSVEISNTITDDPLAIGADGLSLEDVESKIKHLEEKMGMSLKQKKRQISGT